MKNPKGAGRKVKYLLKYLLKIITLEYLTKSLKSLGKIYKDKTENF
jgi:hypothetical protein